MRPLLREMLGETLRELRTSEGMTLREVERGQKEASSELLNAISGALDVQLSELMIHVAARVAAHEETPFPQAAAASGNPVAAA